MPNTQFFTPNSLGDTIRMLDLKMLALFLLGQEKVIGVEMKKKETEAAMASIVIFLLTYFAYFMMLNSKNPEAGIGFLAFINATIIYVLIKKL